MCVLVNLFGDLNLVLLAVGVGVEANVIYI